jgi:hypothetical protein
LWRIGLALARPLDPCRYHTPFRTERRAENSRYVSYTDIIVTVNALRAEAPANGGYLFQQIVPKRYYLAAPLASPPTIELHKTERFDAESEREQPLDVPNPTESGIR